MTIDLNELKQLAAHGSSYYLPVQCEPLAALIEVAEAALEALEALDDAITAAIDRTGWTQVDYDEWHNARMRLEQALAPFKEPA